MNLPPQLQALAWALLHFLWQGLLLWLVAALAFRLSRRAGPQTRYTMGLAFLALALALPLITWWVLDPGPAGAAAALPLHGVTEGAAQSLAFAPLPWALRLRLALAAALPWVLGAWAAGAGVLALRLAGGWLWLQRLKAGMAPLEAGLESRLRDLAQRMGLGRAFRAGVVEGIRSPLVAGWFRPVLLIPASLLTGLDPVGLDALLAHELAHLRRHDVLFNWMQCAVEVLLFYHPAVWWLSRRTRLERECCCDDVAVALCGDPLRYAETLDRLDDLQTFDLSPAQAANGANLMFRITRLLTPKPSAPRLPIALPLAALLATGALALSARTAQQPAPAPSPAPSAAPAAPTPKPSKAKPAAKATEAKPTPAPRAEAKPEPVGLRRDITFELSVMKNEPVRLDLRVDYATRPEVEAALARIEALVETIRTQGENRPSIKARWELKPYKGAQDELMSFVLERVTPTEAKRLF